MSNKLSHLAENKLIILYLINKFGIAISNSEICQFLLEKNYMNYFLAQENLYELTETNFLDTIKADNNTRYILTESGKQTLNLFIDYISDYTKKEIDKYVSENGKRIKSEYEIKANYFPELNNEFSVKCALYDNDGVNLVEIKLLVPSKTQAKLICSNWKKNVSKIYSSITSLLITDESKFEEKKPSNK